MERHRFGNSDLTVSAIGLGCYGMSGGYGPADDAESIATIRRALDFRERELSAHDVYRPAHLAGSPCPPSLMVAPYSGTKPLPTPPRSTPIFITGTKPVGRPNK